MGRSLSSQWLTEDRMDEVHRPRRTVYSDIPTISGMEGFQGTFRFDAGPQDPINDAVLGPLAELMIGISCDADLAPYVDLHLPIDWTEDMIPVVAGRGQKIGEMASRVGAVVLGGAAPIWAYLAGLYCALKANPETRLFFFDPKQPERLVEIPAVHRSGGFPQGVFKLEWETGSESATLRFHVLTEDKFLPPAAAQRLEGAPWFGEIPSTVVQLWGFRPAWICGTYARWLLSAGVRRMAAWDARTKSYVTIWE
jgi:hypothetical protein